MIKDKYKNIPDEEFVPLDDAIDPIFKGKYLINKLGWIKTISTNKVTKLYNVHTTGYPRKSFRVGKFKKVLFNSFTYG